MAGSDLQVPDWDRGCSSATVAVDAASPRRASSPLSAIQFIATLGKRVLALVAAAVVLAIMLIVAVLPDIVEADCPPGYSHALMPDGGGLYGCEADSFHARLLQETRADEAVALSNLREQLSEAGSQEQILAAASDFDLVITNLLDELAQAGPPPADLESYFDLVVSCLQDTRASFAEIRAAMLDDDTAGGPMPSIDLGSCGTADAMASGGG
jgi:hypothetical protein